MGYFAMLLLEERQPDKTKEHNYTFFTSNLFLLAPLLVPLGVSTSIAAAMMDDEVLPLWRCTASSLV